MQIHHHGRNPPSFQVAAEKLLSLLIILKRANLSTRPKVFRDFFLGKTVFTNRG